MEKEELEISEKKDEETKLESEIIDPEIENRATLYGWTPKESFKGDPAKWVSADVFVKRADEILPIARAMNRKLENDLTLTKTELAELRKTMKAVIKTHEKISQDTYNTIIKQIKKDQAQAVVDGNVDEWQRLEDTKDKLSEQKPEEIKFEEKHDTPNPTIVQWKKDNPWYESDPELGMYADSVSNFINARSPGILVDDFLAKVKEEVKKRFPEKFSNQNRKNPPSVDRSNFNDTDNKSAGGKTYGDLPADAKSACNELVKNKTMTKEQYVKIYFEEE